MGHLRPHRSKPSQRVIKRRPFATTAAQKEEPRRKSGLPKAYPCDPRLTRRRRRLPRPHEAIVVNRRDVLCVHRVLSAIG
jgi:hypothetical protein